MTDPRPVYWSDPDLRRRLRRVEGQIRGIEAMVGRAEHCRDILIQLAAIQGALGKVTKIVEACHMAEKMMQQAPADAQLTVDQIQTVVRDVVAGL